MKPATISKPVGAVAAAALVILLTGCPQPEPTPPPEAALEGVWLLTTDEDSDLDEGYLVFDEMGELTFITVETEEGTVVTPVTSSTSSVTGSGWDVDFTALVSVGGLTFSGRFNTTQTRITGDLTTSLNVGGSQIIIDQGAATMERQ